MTPWTNRLTILGPRAALDRFDDDGDWGNALGARHIEWLRLSPRRRVCEFETSGPIRVELQELARVWPRLVFLLDYEWEPRRFKGIARAGAGDIASCEINY